MARFDVKVTSESGESREVSGTVSYEHEVANKARAGTNAATQVRRQLQPGEEITDVQVRYARPDET